MEEEQLVKCECCGLKEECTTEYIAAVKSNFDGKWLCGLCSEAVRDEVSRSQMMMHSSSAVEDAVRAHMSFCRNYKTSPASRVADGMRMMLRRRSAELARDNTGIASKKYGRSTSASQVESSLSRY